MGQYDANVERQRMFLQAEKWAEQPKGIHLHSMSSMWYDNRPSDTENGHVMDIEYNGGWIDRHKNNKLIHTFGKRMSREELIDAYGRAEADAR